MKIKMLEGIEAVIFDFDGTLADSMWMWKNIDIEYLKRFGVAPHDSLQDEISGMSFSETAVYFKEHFHIPDSIQEMKDTWNGLAMNKYRYEITPKPGAIDFLAYLKSHNIKMGVATSNSRELAEVGIESIGAKEYMDTVRVSCEVKAGKPAPDIYLLVAQDLGVLPEHCLVFEDIVNGLMAGKSAGMKTCGVEDEFSAREVHDKKAIADYYIQSYEDILNNTYEVLK